MERDSWEDPEYYVRLSLGLVAAIVLIALSVFSVYRGITLAVPVIGGLLIVIVILIYGAGTLVEVIDSWKNRNG